MKLACITSTFNEIDLIGQFLAHYRRQGVNWFFVFDNFSTDGTYELLKGARDVTCVQYGDPDELDDALKYETILNCKRMIAEQFDYVIMPDVDEFLVPTECGTLREYMEEYPKQIYGSIGYNMVQYVNDMPYFNDVPLLQQRKHGFMFEPYSKTIVHRTNSKATLSVGFHKCSVQAAPDFILLHYVAFDRAISLKRRKRQQARTGKKNAVHSYGSENVGMTDIQWESWLLGHWNNPQVRKVV